MVSEEDKTPTGYNAPKGGNESALTELANFLYAEFEKSQLDDKSPTPEDEYEDPFLEIQEIK